MRPFLTTLAAGTAALLLSGCPDMPSGPAHSDAHWKVSRLTHASHEAAHNPHDSAQDGAGPNAAADHKVSEIAWFQGTIDEAFSRRGCPQSHTRRGLFRF
jgi:hypothetical protein